MTAGPDELASLLRRARCPACAGGPLGPNGGELHCPGCGAGWSIFSKNPLAVRLSEDETEELGEVFTAAPVARSRARRAVWRWHARREKEFLPRIPVVPDSQRAMIAAAYDRLPAGRRGVLDVGGGSGRWRRLLNGADDYTVVDVILPARLDLDPPIVYVLGRAEELPFVDASFDVVLMMEVLEHLPEPRRALAEARRVLPPDGVLVLSTRQAWPTHGAPHDYFRFTRYGLEHLLAETGFAPYDIVPLGGPASIIALTLEWALPSLAKPIVKQAVTYNLWRVARWLDATAFRPSLMGPSPDASGWLVIAGLATSETGGPTGR